MRPVRYNVCSTLDGFIADAHGGFDWIPADPTVDFAALFANVDTVLLGRKSYELVLSQPEAPWAPTGRVYVFSTTLRQADHPDVTVVNDDAAGVVRRLRAEEGTGEIWLFGGGELFKSLLAAGQVDRIEVTVAPILLGGGIPLLPSGVERVPLQLLGTKRYPSGLVTLDYSPTNVAVP